MKQGKGEPSLVSAKEVSLRFHGRPPYGVKFFCPACNQKLTPRSMNQWNERKPHFSHKANNKTAQECEFFVANMGMGNTKFQKAPLPMFIRRALNRKWEYVVEGGFAALSPQILSVLERHGTLLRLGTNRYKVDASRFSSGITRLPFDELSLSPNDYVSLVNSPYTFESLWGSPESATRAMVFTRDPYSNQGKRLRSGDTVPLGSNLFLLTSMQELQAINEAFPSFTKLGTAGSVYGGSRLQVVAVSLPTSDGNRSNAASYLRSCGLKIGSQSDTFGLLWPPSLISSGEIEPAFQGSSLIISVPTSHAAEESVYLHRDITDQCAADELISQPSANEKFRVVETRTIDNSSILTMRRDSLADSVLISTYSNEVTAMLLDELSKPSIWEDDKMIHIDLVSPVNVVRMSKRRGKTEDKLDQDTHIVLTPDDDETVCVYRPLHIPRGSHLTLFKHFGIAKDLESDDSHEITSESRERLLARHKTDGTKLALKRLRDSGLSEQTPGRKLLAQIRRY